jgi:oligopeptide transport system ATP-binding protein
MKPSSAATLLRVDGLTVGVPGRGGQLTTVVDEFGLTVEPGEIVGIAGESGSGKTMSMLAILDLLPEGARAVGSACFRGEDMLAGAKGGLAARRGRDIALVMQDPHSSLHPMIPIGKQLTDHVRYHLGSSSRDARARALDLLGEVRIPDPKGSYGAYPHQFSGGMCQRISIAIALACKPALLIADEPTTGLDVTVQAGILRLLDDLSKTHRLGVVLISHDLGVMAALTKTVTIMYAGRVVEAGPSKAVLTSPRHPYTAALLKALPHPQHPNVPLTPVPGHAMPAHLRPRGCAFHPRCPHARSECAVRVPPLTVVDDGRQLACLVDPFGASDGA